MCRDQSTRQRRYTRLAWKRPLPCAKTMAHGKGYLFAMCFDLRHTANIASLSCVKSRDTRQRSSHRQPPWPLFFLPSVAFCTRQSLCRVPDKKTHGKEALCRCLVALGFLLCATHDKAFAVCKPGFAVCLWHTVKYLCPVVWNIWISLKQFWDIKIQKQIYHAWDIENSLKQN